MKSFYLVQCQVVLVEPKTNDKWIDEEDSMSSSVGGTEN